MTGRKRPILYLYLLLRNRWFLVKALLVVMIPTVLVTFLMTNKYTVSTVIMPPEEESPPGVTVAGLGLAEFAGYFSGGMGFALPLMTTMSDVYEEMLNSRSLVDRVIMTTAFIDSMDLADEYRSNREIGMYWARKKFRERYDVSSTPSGFLKVRFTFRDPDYAVKVSQAVVATLDSINDYINVDRLRQARVFLEQRLTLAASNLEETTRAIKAFEEKYNLIAPEEELQGYIATLADLKARYITLITEIAAMRRGINGSPGPTILYKEREAEQLRTVIDMLEKGEPAPGYEDMMPDLNMKEISDVALEYARLKVDHEMLLQVVSVLKVSLYEAIAAEARQQTRIRVLDPPKHPGWKSKPKKLFIWLEVFLLAFVGLFGYLLARENISRMRYENPSQWEPWDKLIRDIRREVFFWKKKDY